MAESNWIFEYLSSPHFGVQVVYNEEGGGCIIVPPGLLWVNTTCMVCVPRQNIDVLLSWSGSPNNEQLSSQLA